MHVMSTKICVCVSERFIREFVSVSQNLNTDISSVFFGNGRRSTGKFRMVIMCCDAIFLLTNENLLNETWGEREREKMEKRENE